MKRKNNSPAVADIEFDADLFDALDNLVNDKTLQDALRAIPHKTVNNSGEELVFDDIFFLLKMSGYAKLVRPLYPYSAFVSRDGRDIPARNHFDPKIRSAVKMIFEHYNIAISDEYLNSAIEAYEAKFVE